MFKAPLIYREILMFLLTIHCLTQVVSRDNKILNHYLQNRVVLVSYKVLHNKENIVKRYIYSRWILKAKRIVTQALVSWGSLGKL